MLRSWQTEWDSAETAQSQGNQGKVRVCLRRALGAWIIEMHPQYATVCGHDAMKILHALADDIGQDAIVRTAAQRLAGGLRAQLEGGSYSQYPFDDARVIIEYFRGE
jgi:hypothetical protein